jgi:hypothetical protein
MAENSLTGRFGLEIGQNAEDKLTIFRSYLVVGTKDVNHETL